MTPKRAESNWTDVSRVWGCASCAPSTWTWEKKSSTGRCPSTSLQTESETRGAYSKSNEVLVPRSQFLTFLERIYQIHSDTGCDTQSAIFPTCASEHRRESKVTVHEISKLPSKKSWRPKVPESLVKQLRFEECAKCQRILQESDIDHKVPWALVQCHVQNNLQVLCLDCHRRKTRKDLRLLRKVSQDLCHEIFCFECHKVFSKYFSHGHTATFQRLW